MNSTGPCEDRGDELPVPQLMAVLAQACELAFGRPVDHALHSAALALALAERLGLDAGERRDVLRQAMLRFIGCNHDTGVIARAFGDEIEGRRALALVPAGDDAGAVAALLKLLAQRHADEPLLRRMGLYARGLAHMPGIPRDVLPGHCEVAQRLGLRLGFDERFTRGLGQLYARWDGRGIPSTAGEAIHPAVRIVSLAQDAVTAWGLGGWAAVEPLLRERSGRQHDPRLCALLLKEGPALCEAHSALRWQDLWDREPGPPEILRGPALDGALAVVADHADIKSPFLLTHAARVSALARAAAEAAGLPATQAKRLQHAALLHDVGRVGVSAAVWDKPGALSQSEWQRVQQHSLYTRQILGVAPALQALAEVASSAHERCDGSGYFRARRGADSASANLLAASDCYAALTEARPHRPARAPAEAAGALQAMVREGRLDAAAVDAVLSVEGHVAQRAAQRMQSSRPAGLTDREAQVLGELARGRTNKEIARRLGIAPKTVGRHLESVYAKAGVGTRAGATLFAMEHGLVPPG